MKLRPFRFKMLSRTLQLVIAAGFVFASLASSARSSDLIWGVNGHPFSAYPGISFQKQLDLVKDLGMTSYRVNVSSVDSIRGLADLAALGRERGISILPVLTPGLGLKEETTDALYAKSFNFAVTMVSALKHSIRIWELGNELENFAILQPCETQDDGKQYPCSNGPASGVSPLEYHGARWSKVSAVLKGMSDGVISVDPTLKKAIGTAGWGHVGAFQRMENDGIRWDISIWHSYQADPEWVIEKVAAFKRPIWVTEFNHPYGSRDGVAAQAQGTKTMMDRLRQWRGRFNIEAAFFYELLDEPYWAPDFEAVMGLVTLVKSDTGDGWTVSDPKPAYDVVKTAIAQSSKTALRSCSLEPYKTGAITAQRQVAYAYCLVLGRDVDGQGAADWSRRISDGLAVQPFMLLLVDSEEFTNRHLWRSVSHRDFISLAFQVLLDRKPDGGGLQSYLAELNRGGMRRRDVLAGMLGSAEFRAKHPFLFAPVQTVVGADSATSTNN